MIRLDFDYDAMLDEQVRPVATHEISLKVDLEWYLSLDVHASIAQRDIHRSFIYTFEETKAKGIVNNEKCSDDLPTCLTINEFSRWRDRVGHGVISIHQSNP